MKIRGLLFLALSSWAAGACGTSPSGAPHSLATEPNAMAAAEEEPPGPVVAAPAAQLQGTSLVTDPLVLAELRRAGAEFKSLVPAPSWQAIRKALEQDVRAVRRSDSAAGVGIRGNAHRLFDVSWLEAGNMQLVGLAFRVDRIPMTAGRCGDVRLIYRLGYTTEVSGQTVSSRLPMTVLLVLPGPKKIADDCASAAKAWMAPVSLKGPDLGRWLTEAGGPLASALTPEAVEQALVNFQQVRWPSAVRPDLGGHAEYVLRAFRPNGDGVMTPAALDNTPDVAAIARNKGLRDALRQWIQTEENLAAIAEGTASLPEKFRAKRAISVAPRGLARRANRPFRQLFSPRDFEGGALAGRKIIGSPSALLRRLDDMSCVGCHQSRTIAGFHLLGEDGPQEAPGNALHVSISPALHAEQRRRDLMIAALAAGEAVDFTRPMAERIPSEPGTDGARCGLGDPGFADWTCAAGFQCVAGDVPADDNAVGYCVPLGPASLGGACEMATIAPHANPHRDRAPKAAQTPCVSGVCNGNRVGFPGGMCTDGCQSLGPEGTCGVIALLTPFNNCLARKVPFPKCLADHVAPAGMRACSAQVPCREDYICARTPAGNGACIPPYFLFQMRVDGHP